MSSGSSGDADRALKEAIDTLLLDHGPRAARCRRRCSQDGEVIHEQGYGANLEFGQPIWPEHGLDRIGHQAVHLRCRLVAVG